MSDGMQRNIRDKSKPRLLSGALHSNRTWYGLSGPVWHIVYLAFPVFCCMPLGCPPMSSAITLDTMGIKLGFLATNIHQGWILIPFTILYIQIVPCTRGTTFSITLVLISTPHLWLFSSYVPLIQIDPFLWMTSSRRNSSVEQYEKLISINFI